uniref:Uncharacterized protein n=1 Tax=Ciona intestinalis TaxID=7719 RepID=H2XKF5_CIOIN
MSRIGRTNPRGDPFSSGLWESERCVLAMHIGSVKFNFSLSFRQQLNSISSVDFLGNCFNLLIYSHFKRI